MFTRLTSLLPKASFVGLEDMLEKVRSIKSAEELDMLRKAAKLGDLMLSTCRDIARPGVKECEVYAGMMQAMMANGGEEPTLFLWDCDRYPYPHPFRMPTTRPMQRGDLIICEMHPKFGGYFTHVERTFCLGEPEKQQLAIYMDASPPTSADWRIFGPGKSISVALDAVKEETDARPRHL